MDNFEQKFHELQQLTNELDNYIWSIFYRYIEQEKILFNSPKGWEIDDDSIHFHGTDGCMGCYDSMSINIPLKFFINPDAEFEALSELQKQEQKEKEAKDRKTKESVERREFERLKQKYA